jgi:hypothetical protein
MTKQSDTTRCVTIDSNIVVFVPILDIMSAKSRYLYHRQWRRKRKELNEEVDRMIKKLKRDSQSKEVTGGDAGMGDSGDDGGLSNRGGQPQSIVDDDDPDDANDHDADDSHHEEVVDNANDDPGDDGRLSDGLGPRESLPPL